MSFISSIENQEGRFTAQCQDCRFVVCHFLPRSSILLTFQKLYINYLVPFQFFISLPKTKEENILFFMHAGL
jgi:hypothetical protein